ncbi:MAG: cell division protein FtsB [Methylovulum sp.]|nr:cell division protein FtsB [Methylovulum sp.]
MKTLIVIILVLIAHLQYRLWLGTDSIAQIEAAELRLANLKKQVDEKKQRNDALYAEVEDLRKGQEALEERARDELGMIKENETFFQVLE